MTRSPNTSGAVPWVAVGPALLWTLAFFTAPFIAMALISVTVKGGGFSLSNYQQFFTDPSYYRALFNSLQVTALVTVISILLAYPFAWILAERIPERWQRLALILAILPFWTSYVVRSYSWLLVLAEKGVVNNALVQLGLISEPIQLANTRFATVTGFVHFFVMLLTLTIFANLKQLSPSYRKAAADLGAGPVRTFLHVILPLTLPGIMVGAFLTFVLATGDYITPQILGGNNELLMPQLIMLQIGRRGDFPLASALAILLMAVVTVAYLLCARWLKIERT
ncbi:ABC transporter permease [Nordella sp. HKS 07]|uniref:ABC transporter permease n=1 Tax=Nordella sp. HKS 07 TaxID=2712222 RepID=UPI0013E1DC3C|nr:ABC transporter permease [Nordella sp. HKS 07]QIG52395.1 ABC transporter permease [Nordella sp. HKS 07]